MPLMQDVKDAVWPRNSPDDIHDAKEWRPYEDLPWWSLDQIRNIILPPSIAKRHFFLPRLNLVGLTFFEAVIALAILGGIIGLGFAQRTAKAESSGSIAQILWIPLFLFITYRSVITWIFGISFERGMFWHGFFALIATAYGIWHGVAAMYWAELDDDHGGKPIRGLQAFTRGKCQYAFITGAFASLFMLLLVVTSFHPFRREARRVWLWSHHLLLIPAVVFSLLHGAPVVLVGVGIYLVDRLFGYIYQAWFQYRSMGTEGKAEVLPSGLIRLSFPRLLSFMPGQFMCLQVPKVSVFEYHTFTIASVPSDGELTFLIQPDGYWSRKLQRKVQTEMGNVAQPVLMRALLHGPVGSVALDWQSSRYEAFVLVAGGIGVTPMMAVYRHLADQKRRGRPVHIAQLIWGTRSRQLVDDVVLSQLRSKGGTGGGFSPEDGYGHELPGVEAKIFLTRDGDEQKTYPYVAASASPEAEVLSRVQWNRGRPDLKEIFGAVERAADGAGVSRVAVLACGPGALTADVCKFSRKLSSRAVRFDVHLEHFY